MENQFIEKLAYYDCPNNRVTIHYHYNGEKFLRVVFKYLEGVPDQIDGRLRDYMQMTEKEESIFLKNRRDAAWKRLCKITVY